MSDQVRIKVLVETGLVSNHEDEVFIDRSDWEAMTEEEREEFLNETALDLRDSYIICSAWVAKEGSRAAFEIKRVGYTPSDEVLSRLGGPL